MSSKLSGSKGKMVLKGNLKKKTHLSLAEKISLIQDYHKIGCQKGVLAALHNCTDYQINIILKDKKKYLKEWAQETGMTIDANRIQKNSKFIRQKSRNKSEQVVIGAVVYEWIKRFRSRGFSVTHSKIREVAREVAYLLNSENFKATDTWVNGLKKKYKLNGTGPLKPKKYKLKTKILDLKKILLEFIECGPPRHLNRRFLNDIDLTKLKFTQKKKYKARSVKSKIDNLQNNEVLQISDSELSDGHITSSSESNDFITAMQIDDDDEEAPALENQLSVAEETNDTITVMTNPNREEPANTQRSTAKMISSYKEALQYLRPLQNFALMQEDVRAIKRINKLNSLFAEELLPSSV